MRYDTPSYCALPAVKERTNPYLPYRGRPKLISVMSGKISKFMMPVTAEASQLGSLLEFILLLSLQFWQ